MHTQRRPKILELLFVVAILLNVLTWFHARYVTSRWLNVPPVPSEISASSLSVGDKQFAYRVIGTMLQNLGDEGGRSTPLNEYNYNEISKWLFLADKLDPKSHYMPFLASFYFGAVEQPEKVKALLDYLAMVGQRSGGERWRWLAHAVYLARWQVGDLDKALELSYILADLKEPNLPLWTKQMPAFVLNAKGNKEEAVAVMLEILKTSADNIHPNEVNYTRDYICTRILEEEEAAKRALCADIP